MIVKSITVQGFRSFGKPQSVNFAALRPGLYHLAGRNDVEPGLEGNGAGKSSLLEALCWGLYGRTSRNLKAGSVKGWGSKEKCAVILQVQTTAGDIGIFRVWNPNTLEVSVDGAPPRPVEQKELDVLLGVTPEAFLFSVYFAQFSPAFIDLRPAEQMSVYSTVLGLDIWASASEKASARSREWEGGVARRREALARTQGSLAEAERYCASLDEEECQWLESVVAREEALTKTLKGAASVLKSAEAERGRFADAAKLARALREQVEHHSRLVANATAHTESILRELAKLTSKDLKNCPTCGAPLKGNTHIKQEIDEKQRSLATAQATAKERMTEHEKLEKELAKLRSDESKQIEAERRCSAAEAEHRNARLTLERHAKEENPYTSRRAEGLLQIKTLKERADLGARELERVEAEQKAFAFWSKGFKELRLSLIEESLAQLSVEANAALVGLGLRDWSLGFDVERETKSGGINKGFTVSVGAPHVQGAVPWEAWSGGESQRLRVASSLGFGELVCSRMGVQPSLELWDEPSTWLSEAGIQDLLAALADRAHSKGKVIILADHRALDFGGFSGTINVVKTAAGSRVTVDAPAYNSA